MILEIKDSGKDLTIDADQSIPFTEKEFVNLMAALDEMNKISFVSSFTFYQNLSDNASYDLSLSMIDGRSMSQTLVKNEKENSLMIETKDKWALTEWDACDLIMGHCVALVKNFGARKIGCTWS